MKEKFRNLKISQKLVCGILAAQLVGAVLVLLFAWFVYRPYLQNKELDQAQLMGHMLANDVENTFYAIERYAAFLSASPELEQSIASGEAGEVETALSQLKNMSPIDIRGIVLVQDEGYISTEQDLGENDLKYLSSDWLARVKKSLVPNYTPLYPADQVVQEYTLGYAFPFEDSGQVYIVFILYDATELMTHIDHSLMETYSGYTLASAYGPTFHASGSYGNAKEWVADSDLRGDYTTNDEEGYYIVTCLENGWRICGVIDNMTFRSGFNGVFLCAVGMCLTLAVLSVVMLIWIGKKITRPVVELQQTMQIAEGGNIDVRAVVNSEDEVGQLAGYFNQMLGRLKEYMDRQIEYEVNEQTMQFNLLLTQVNVHFVYNTMSTINSLARMGDCQGVLKANTALIQILQNTLTIQDGGVFDSVAEEVSVLQAYWAIEEVRMATGAELVLSVDETVKSRLIPKNLLQPLVENSLRHGLTDEETGLASGKVCVTVEDGEEGLIIAVADNGRGIPEKLLERLNSPSWEETRTKGRHIGISNLKKRLEMLYRGQATMEITSHEGTQVRIVIPREETHESD